MDYPRDQDGFARQGSKRAGEDYPGSDKRARNTRDDYTHVAPHHDYGMNPEQQGVEDPWREAMLFQINNPLTHLPGIDQDTIMPKPEERNPILPYDILLARYLPPKQRYQEYAAYHTISIAAYGPFDQYRKEARITLGMMSDRIQKAEWQQLDLWVKERIFDQMIEQLHFTEPKTLHILGIPEQCCATHLKDIDFERNIKPIFDLRQPLLNTDKPQRPQLGHPMKPGHGQTFAHPLSSEQSGQTEFEPVQRPLGRPPVLNNADNPIVIDDEDDGPVQAATVHQSQGLTPGVKRRSTAALSASPKRQRLESYEPRNDLIGLNNSGNFNTPLQAQNFAPVQAPPPAPESTSVQACGPVEATPLVATDNSAPVEAAASVQDDVVAPSQDAAPVQAISPAQAPSANDEATVSKKPGPVSKEEQEKMKRWMQQWEEDRNLAMNVFKGRPGFMNGPLAARFNRGDFKYKDARLAYTHCLASQVAAEQQEKAKDERTAKLKADSRARERAKKQAKKEEKRREELGLPEPGKPADKGDAESEPKDDLSLAIMQAPEEDSGEDKAEPQAPQEAELEDDFSRAMMEAFDKDSDDAEAEPLVPQGPTHLSEPAASPAPTPSPEPTPDPEPTAAIAPQDDHIHSSTKEDEAIVAPSPSSSDEDEDGPLGNDREASSEPLPVTADDEVIVEAAQSAGNDHDGSFSEDGNQIPENVEASLPVQDEAVVEPSPSSDGQVVTDSSALLEEDDMGSLFGDDEEMPDTPPTSKEKTYQPVLEEPAAPPSPSQPPVLNPHPFGVVDEDGVIDFTADEPLEGHLDDDSDHETDDELEEESKEESDEEIPPEVEKKNREIAEVDEKIAAAQEKFKNTTNKIWQKRLQAEIDKLSQQKIALNAELGELTGL